MWCRTMIICNICKEKRRNFQYFLRPFTELAEAVPICTKCSEKALERGLIKIEKLVLKRRKL